jgi:hypothetical protein
MDLHGTIRQLLIEKKRVERAIAMLEELQSTISAAVLLSRTNAEAGNRWAQKNGGRFRSA